LSVVSRRSILSGQTVRAVCLFVGFVTLFATVSAPLMGQSRLNRPPPRYLQIGTPDQAEGAEILRSMRAAGPDGDYYLEFELRVLPRRGDGPRIPGRLWGSRNADGPVSRLSLLPPGEPARSILVQGGPNPAAWQWPAADGAAIIAVDEASLFTPLAGSDLSAFDLQMPFLYWPEFVYEGKSRLYERPVDTFLLYPPESLAKHRPDLAAMRVYLDPNYHALVQAEQLGENGRVLKSFRVVSLSRVGDRYLVKSVELRDETTRNKTRFSATAAALGLDFSKQVFAPGNLAAELAAPAELTRLSE
jgi:hypothetical protein